MAKRWKRKVFYQYGEGDLFLHQFIKKGQRKAMLMKKNQKYLKIAKLI